MSDPIFIYPPTHFTGIQKMHQYSTDVTRWRVIAGIGAVSLFLTIVFNPAIEQLVPDALSNGASLTVLTIAGVIFYGYKYLLWFPVGRLFDGRVPNINGEWILEEDSADILSIGTQEEEVKERLLIDQDWTEMQVDYLNEQGVYLRSDSGKVSTSGSNNPELVLTCAGEVPSPEMEEYQKVEGTFRLRLVRTSDGEQLIGRYYSNLGNVGSSRVKFQLNSRRLVRRRTVPDELDKKHDEFRST